MIAFAGIGSLLSDQLRLEGHIWHYAIPIAIAVMIVTVTSSIQPILDTTVGMKLIFRCLVAVATTAPLSTLLGFCFPIGMRLVSMISSSGTPWMWGVNGACGVLASILAVAISM